MEDAKPPVPTIPFPTHPVSYAKSALLHRSAKLALALFPAHHALMVTISTMTPADWQQIVQLTQPYPLTDSA